MICQMSLTQRRSGWLRWHSQFTLPRTVGREPVTAHSPPFPPPWQLHDRANSLAWAFLRSKPKLHAMQDADFWVFILQSGENSWVAAPSLVVSARRKGRSSC